MAEKREVIVNENEYSDPIEEAKKSALALMKNDTVPTSFVSLFDDKNLEEIEHGVKQMNEYADRCWLLSALIVFSIIWDHEMFKQSGLSWEEYAKAAKERLGLESRDLYEQLTSARFFIKYHRTLMQKGWNPVGSRRKLARAELAMGLCGSADETIDHLVKDTWADFNMWYSKIKNPEKFIDDGRKKEDAPRDDIKVLKSGKVTVNGIEPVEISKSLQKDDRDRLQRCIAEFFQALHDGYYPAVIPTYNENEAKSLILLRDKRRSTK